VRRRLPPASLVYWAACCLAGPAQGSRLQGARAMTLLSSQAVAPAGPLAIMTRTDASPEHEHCTATERCLAALPVGIEATALAAVACCIAVDLVRVQCAIRGPGCGFSASAEALLRRAAPSTKMLHSPLLEHCRQCSEPNSVTVQRVERRRRALPPLRELTTA
jgi:hypothetical protein